MFSGALNLKNDDDDDFIGIANSNLANIFGINLEKDNESNEITQFSKNLMKSNDVTDNNYNPDKISWTVVIAKALLAFKQINSQNIAQGRLGVALLKSNHQNFKIVIYRTKQNILSTTNIQKNSKLYFQNDYFQFHDDTSICWSFLLEDNKQLFLDELVGKCQLINEVNNPAKVMDTCKNEKIGEIQQPENNLQENPKKENILSRVSKMGQSMLLLNNPAVIKEAVAENKSKSELLLKSDLAKNVTQSSNSLSLIDKFQLNNQNVLPHLMESSETSILISENRIYNSEMRINIAKLENKVERVLDKLELLEFCQNKKDAPVNIDEILKLEEKVLELKKENRDLKNKLFEIQAFSQNEKSTMYASENQIVEKFTYFETELTKYIEQLDNAKLENKQLIEEINLNQKSKQDLEIRFNTLHEKNENISSKLNNSLSTSEKVMRECAELKSKLENIELKNREEFREEIKTMMNNLYQVLSVQFTGKDSYQEADILRIIKTTIKYEINQFLK